MFPGRDFNDAAFASCYRLSEPPRWHRAFASKSQSAGRFDYQLPFRTASLTVLIPEGEEYTMNIKVAVLSGLATLALISSGPASAKGAVKGAVVGATAGHFVGHGHAKSGAVAGAIIGHHHAAKKAKTAP